MGAGYFLALDLESVPKSFLFLFFTASICVVWFVVWFFFFSSYRYMPLAALEAFVRGSWVLWSVRNCQGTG